jgi:hypothetical protein
MLQQRGGARQVPAGNENRGFREVPAGPGLAIPPRQDLYLDT